MDRMNERLLKTRSNSREHRQLVVESRNRVWWSCLMTPAQLRTASHSMCAFPRVRSASTMPSSLVRRAFSRSSSFLSRVRSCSRNSTITAGSIATSEEALKQTTCDNQCHNKQARQVSNDVSQELTQTLTTSGWGDIQPRSTGWHWADLVERTPTVRTPAAIVPTCNTLIFVKK
jgi:hypothetical protein